MSAIPCSQTCQPMRPFKLGDKSSQSLFDVHDEWPSLLSNGYEVIGSGEEGKLQLLLECFHLSTDVRLVDVKSFRGLSVVQLVRNGENILELSVRGNDDHKFTTRMKWSDPQISLH